MENTNKGFDEEFDGDWLKEFYQPDKEEAAKYHDSSYAKAGFLQDPIQAHLERMEKKNPSPNKHEQGILKRLYGHFILLDRAVGYYTGKTISKNMSCADFRKNYESITQNSFCIPTDISMQDFNPSDSLSLDQIKNSRRKVEDPTDEYSDWFSELNKQ